MLRHPAPSLVSCPAFWQKSERRVKCCIWTHDWLPLLGSFIFLALISHLTHSRRPGQCHCHLKPSEEYHTTTCGIIKCLNLYSWWWRRVSCLHEYDSVRGKVRHLQTDVTAAGRCNYELQHLSDCNHFVNLMEELRSAIIVAVRYRCNSVWGWICLDSRLDTCLLCLVTEYQ